MVLDSENIKRLQEIGRELPKKIEIPDKSLNKKPISKNTKHKIETENNPEILFHSLMEASPDGSVPSHLVNRLKQLEINQKDIKVDQDSVSSNSSQKNKSTKQSVNSSKQEDNLYLTFKNLLLEEES